MYRSESSEPIGIELRCPLCGNIFRVCPKCYRGHRYCSKECSAEARRASQQRAKLRYKTTFKCRQAGARRAATYRERHREPKESPLPKKSNGYNFTPNTNLGEIELDVNLEIPSNNPGVKARHWCCVCGCKLSDFVMLEFFKLRGLFPKITPRQGMP